MVLHKDLTGADLHEPKGVSTASADTVYVANGSGTGAWEKIDTNNIDQTSIKNTNKFQLVYQFRDIGTVASKYLPVPVNCTLTKVTMVLESATAGATTVISLTNNGASSIGNFSPAGGAAAGTVYQLTSPTNPNILAGNYIKLDTDGGTTNTPDATFVFEFTMT